MALDGHAKGVRDVALSPDGTRLASVDWDNAVKLWDVSSTKEQRTIRLTDFSGMAFSPDGTRLATADRFDRRVSVWDTRSGEKLYSILSHARIVTAVAFSPAGNTLAAAGGERRDPDLSVRLWPGQTDPAATTFRGHESGVWSAAFLPDGERVSRPAGPATTGRGRSCCGTPGPAAAPVVRGAHEHRILRRRPPGRKAPGDRQCRQDGSPVGHRQRARGCRSWRATRER